ncbi:hypothetical protein LEP1GSC062_2414 [Leptospira alexanderi serovar Manhao 3 str. L 60]|uniref:Aminotransferase, class I/II domain protein n=1 Tax=Leptospira alexanderi serovar Manhao 3 str. L 60 TaxID=1049759 RepID=V6I0A4_9LEPT|nr:hypothetical protein LEP1GSC062_2414 [Leptospira alexanderi serovar Manhao 3 str. L 60]
MQYSIFGRKFSEQTGIGQLMDDLGCFHPGSCLLGGGNPAFIPEVTEVWKEIISKQIESGSIQRIIGSYESPSGIPELRETIASILSEESGTKITEDQIAITNGSQNAFYFLLNFFSGNFGNGQRKKFFFPFFPNISVTRIKLWSPIHSCPLHLRFKKSGINIINILYLWKSSIRFKIGNRMPVVSAFHDLRIRPVT